MGLVVVGVASALLFCGAVTAIGPPPGSRGTLDFRYPDYIVDPLVPCPFEGVFPHPRNCTWYYRCYDRYGLGFFWRAYFECEPGTVFLDALDQCVGGYASENCALDQSTGSTPDPYTKPKPITPAVIIPVTYPQPITPPLPPSCHDVVQQCEPRAVCPTAVGNTSMHVLLDNYCAVAEKRCTDGSRQPLCQAGQAYNAGNQRCEFANLCQSSPRPVSPLVCEDVLLGCTNYYSCVATLPEVPETLTRCQITQLCSRAGVEVSRAPLCPAGQSFDPINNKCAPDVIAFAGCVSSIATGYGPPPQPVCQLQTESCQILPVCKRSDGLQALQCRRFFSCERLWRSSTRSVAGYPAAAPTCIEFPDEPSCKVSFSSCRQGAFCPPGIDTSVFVQRVQVCDAATNVCSDGSSTGICRAGLTYDVDQQVCRDNSTSCVNHVRPEAPIICEDILESCQDMFICPNTPDIPEMVRRCDIVQVCYKNEMVMSRTSLCPSGQKFDALQNRCVQDDAGSYPCGPGLSSLPPSTPVCESEAERCIMTPICDSVDSALVCRKYFSCGLSAVPASPILTRITGYPSSGPACLPLIIPDEPVCRAEPEFASCQQETICPEAFGSSRSPSVLPPSSLFVQSLEVCREAYTTCKDGTQTSLCTFGEIYIKEKQQCWKGSDLCQAPDPRAPSSIVCEDVLEDEGCQDSYVCRTNPFVAEVVRQCNLFTVCTQDGVEISRQPLCPGGKFDSVLNQCAISSPSPFECAAGAVARPLPQPVCKLESETCLRVPVCQTNLFALQCRQLFSCTPSLSTSIVAGRMSTFRVGQRVAGRDVGCVPISALVSPPPPSALPTCQEGFTLNNCRLQALCPNITAYQSSLFVENVEVCSVARKHCTDGTQKDVCGPGEVYYVVARTCLPESIFCRNPEPRPSSPLVCEDTIENCQDSYGCLNSPLQPSLLRRCDMFRTCFRDGAQITKQPLCPNGKFDASLNQCVDDAPSVYQCAGQPNDPSPPVCDMVSEYCSDSPVCKAPDTVLVCKRLFACDNYSPPVAREAYFPSALACTELPGFGPETCEVILRGCQATATCPAEWEGLASQVVPVLQLCTSAEKVCSRGTRSPVCPSGELYNDKELSCVSQSTLCVPETNPRPPSPLVCEDVLVQCTASHICPNTTDEPEVVRRCTLNRTCTRDGNFVSQKSLCPDGDFDAFHNQCVPPIPASFECPSAVVPSPPAQPQCRVERERCAQTPVCRSQEYGLLCKKLFSCSDSFGFRAKNYFPRQESECLEAAGSEESLDFKIPLTCSFDGDIPMPDELQERFCPFQAMCDPPFAYVDSRRACEEFYRCQLVGGVLTPVLQRCPPGQVLLPTTKTCVVQNTEHYMLCSAISSVASPTETTIQVVEITTTPAPAPTPPKEEFPQSWNTTLRCSFHNEIPVNDAIKKINCDTKPICHPDGAFEKLETLCYRFYVCRLDGNHFVIDESECTGGLLFHYGEGNEQSKCVQPSPNVCRRFLRQP